MPTDKYWVPLPGPNSDVHMLSYQLEVEVVVSRKVRQSLWGDCDKSFQLGFTKNFLDSLGVGER